MSAYFHKNRRYGSGKPIDTALAVYMNQALKPILRKKTQSEYQIVTDWSLIVGETIASYGFPTKITYPSAHNQQAILHVTAINGAAAMHIQYQQAPILEAIARYIGKSFIQRIQIKQQNRPAKNVSDSVITKTISQQAKHKASESITHCNIDDPDMRAALEKLGRQVFAQSESKKG